MSSSCTRVIEASHIFTVDQESLTIQLTWHVVAFEEKLVDGMVMGTDS
jgi:hypothetical protein